MDNQNSFLSNKVGHWISEQTGNSYIVSGSDNESELIKTLIENVYTYDYPSNVLEAEKKRLRGLILASAFDLLVSAEYFKSVGHSGWVYCPFPDNNPYIYYPYTNICPRCVVSNGFHFHKANKPPSGSIGAITSKLLGMFLGALFKKHGSDIEIRKGSEPVDTIFIDKTKKPEIYLFAEVKSAPLLTLPLAMKTEKMTQEEDNTAKALISHESVNIAQLYSKPLELFIPIRDAKSHSGWQVKVYSIGSKENEKDSEWAYKGIIKLLKTDKDFFSTYAKFWIEAMNEYESNNEGKQPIFWLTNACGQPVPRPESWPRRASGAGYESVSDGKTSVGMDRTDDIKKATYQVLKLGAEGKPAIDKIYLVGIVSNIHAVRHFDEYLTNLKDIIWTRDESGTITNASQLDPNTEFYNLFDGIISLTNTVARNSWIKKTFDF
ncbi:MAG: hypothetical protein JNJ43_02355 [Anaerolineales bacterium]|nr:hypothetical protein [Anaerolineales bacterium]